MDKDQQDQKEFLEQQLRWTEEQACILDEMDNKLHEMKRIAEYVLEHDLSEIEIERLNSKLNVLKREVDFLQKQLYFGPTIN